MSYLASAAKSHDDKLHSPRILKSRDALSQRPPRFLFLAAPRKLRNSQDIVSTSALPIETTDERLVRSSPARYGSDPFSGRAFAATIGGKPMIQHVYESARHAARDLIEFWLADRRSAYRSKPPKSFGGEVMMTSKSSCGAAPT